MITDEFRRQVQTLRDEGKSWPEVSRITGRPQRTCHRALETTERICDHRGCDLPVPSTTARLCKRHAWLKQHSKPGRGERQQQVLAVVRRHGLASAEQIRNETGLDSTNLGHVTGRLVHFGLLERPVRGHYRIPGPNTDGTKCATSGRMVVR